MLSFSRDISFSSSVEKEAASEGAREMWIPNRF